VTIPALGMAMTEALLLTWLKKPGDAVGEGEPIAEIETDKATMDLESPAAGTLGRHLFEAGALVPIASPVCRILEPGEIEPGDTVLDDTVLDDTVPDDTVPDDTVPGDTVPDDTVPAAAGDSHDPAASESAQASASAPVAAPAAFGIYDELHPVETLAPSVFDKPAATAPAARQTVAAPPAAVARVAAPAVATVASTAAGAHRAPHTMSPRQRRLAREAAAAGTSNGAGSSNGAASSKGAASPAGRRREAIAQRVSEAWRTIPHFAVTREIDGSAAVKALKALRVERPDATMTDLLLHAFAVAADWLGVATSIASAGDVGLAVATPDGVMMPVVTGAAKLSASDMIAARQDATRRGRDGHLSKTDVTSTPVGSLSNLGALGVDSFTGIIPLGQLCLLTIGRIAPRLVPTENGFSTAQTLQATLNVDHRSIDGDVAARALDVFAQALGSVQTWANGGQE
jgi:pyruvate dehydrogenase E2 component (dihydrolipoamide acetyltransferase)